MYVRCCCVSDWCDATWAELRIIIRIDRVRIICDRMAWSVNNLTITFILYKWVSICRIFDHRVCFDTCMSITQFPSTRCQHFVWIDLHLSFSSASFQVLHTSPVPIWGMIDELSLTWRIDRGVRCGKHPVGVHSSVEMSMPGSGGWVTYV